MTDTPRTIQRIIPGQPASDGAGVKLRRSLGATQALRLDPFLMLDEFSSDDPNDYVAGFPAHPHRGFETVTYMLNGRMQHQDHMGNTGDLGPGGVQWMTAGRGIIHSEMPQQREGRMRGFQLWINLPSAEKMVPADYDDIPPEAVTTHDIPGIGHLRLIAGRLTLEDTTLSGPVNGDGGKSTDPLYVDVQLAPDAALSLPVTAGYNAFVYAYEGALAIEGSNTPLQSVGVLGDGNRVRLQAGGEGARALLLAGKPIGEPIAQYGPFVMNTRAEIEQALDDFRRGTLAAAN